MTTVRAIHRLDLSDPADYFVFGDYPDYMGVSETTTKGKTVLSSEGDGYSLTIKGTEKWIFDPVGGFEYWTLKPITSISLSKGAAQIVEFSNFNVNLDMNKIYELVQWGVQAQDSKYFISYLLRGSDTIIGSNYSDFLMGYAGNDILSGGKGNDRLRGGAGKDTYTGGLGADDFIFNSIAEAGKGTLRDVVKDFSRSQGDDIDLRIIDASTKTAGDQAFKFIDGAAFTGVAGQLREKSGLIQGDVNGDKIADFEITLSNLENLTINEFLL